MIGSDLWKKKWHDTLVETDHGEEMDDQDKLSESTDSNITPSSSQLSNSATITESETWSQNQHRHSQDNVSTTRSTNSIEEQVYHTPSQSTVRHPLLSQFMPTSLFPSEPPSNDILKGKQKGLFEESDDDDIFNEIPQSTSKAPINIPVNQNSSFFRDQKSKPQPVNIFNDEPPSDPIVNIPVADNSVAKKQTNLFVDDEDEDVGFENSINFSQKSQKPKKISLFDDQPPSDEEPPPIRPPTVRVMPEKTLSKPNMPKVPAVDLFNDNDFDSFIQNIEKKPEKQVEQPKPTKVENKIHERKVAPKITNLFDDEPETDYFEELLKNKKQSKIVNDNLNKSDSTNIENTKSNALHKQGGLFEENLNESASDLFASTLKTKSLFDEPQKKKNLFNDSRKSENLFDEMPAKPSKILDNKVAEKTDIKPVSLFDDEPPLDFENNNPLENILAAKRTPVKNAVISKVITNKPLFDESPPVDFISSTKATKEYVPEKIPEKKEDIVPSVFKPKLPLFDEHAEDNDVLLTSENKMNSLFDDLPAVAIPKFSEAQEDLSPRTDSSSDFLHSVPTSKSKNVSAMFLDEEPPEDLDDNWETEADGDSDDSKPSFFVTNQSNLSFSSSAQLFDNLPPPDDFDSMFSKSNKQSISSKMFLDYDEDDTTNSPRTSSLSSLSSPIGILSDEPPPDDNDEINTSFKKKLDLFKNNTVVDKLEEVKEKNPPKKLNINFNTVNADKKEEIKEKTSPKKLNMNFNINVNALLPGARPIINKETSDRKNSESSSSFEDSVKETISDLATNNTNKIHKTLEHESVVDSPFPSTDGTDSNNNSRLLNNDMAKSRAKINIKRRPSTKRGRQATMQRVLTTQDILDGNIHENNVEPKDDNDNSEKNKEPAEAQKSFLPEINKNIDPVRSMSISEESYSPIKEEVLPVLFKAESKVLESITSINVESQETKSFIDELKGHLSTTQNTKSQVIIDKFPTQTKTAITNGLIDELKNEIDSVKQLSNVTHVSKSLFEDRTTDIKDIPRTDSIAPSLKNFTTNKISVFYDDEEDILDLLAKNKKELKIQEVPAEKVPTPIKHVTADIFVQKSNAISSALFDDVLFNQQIANVSARHVSKSSLNTSIFDDGDDDLFSEAAALPKSTTKVFKQNPVANPPTTTSAAHVKQKSAALFEDDLSDDDLFGTKVGLSKTPKLFGSDEEEPKDNIFSVVNKIKKEKETKKPLRPVQQSLFGEEDLDDDLFATKSKKGN